MKAHARTTGLVLAVCGAAGSATLGACDPRGFDDLAAETWVHSSEPPAGLSSQVYAVAIAGGGAAPGAGAGFFVASRLEDGFAHLRYDAGGALAASSLDLGDVTLEAGASLPQDPVLVGDPASSLVAAALISSAGAERAWVALLDSDSGQATARLALDGPESIAALAFGSTGVTGGAQDIALVRGDTLVVLPDVSRLEETSSMACRLGGAAGTSLVMAELDAAPAAAEIALVADIDGSGTPELIITTGAQVEAAAATAGPDMTADCFADGRQPLLIIDAPGGAPDFGRRMVAADFNDNGTPDLAVSAPGAGGSGMVYVYLDVDASGARAPLEIPAPAGADEFGLALAAGDLDGAGGHELAIGAPATAAAGEPSAGAVYLYGFEDGGFGEPYVLADARPEAEQRLGKSLAVVGFGGGGAILAVGASKEVFTYFRTPLSSDVRE